MLVREGKPFKAGEADAVVFDIDGVLVDVKESYWQAIIKTTQHFAGEKISENEIRLFKDSGKFNNDWDLAYAVGLYFVLKKEGLAGFSIAEYVEKIREKGGGIKNAEELAKGLAGEKWAKVEMEWDRKRIWNIFQEIYLGSKKFSELHKGRPELNVEKGSMEKEKVLVEMKTIEALEKKGIRIGILTGRLYAEAAITLKKCGLEGKIERKYIVSEDDFARFPDDRRKPNPFGLLELSQRMNAKKIIYIGDIVDDIAAANAAKKEKKGFYSVAVAGASDEAAIALFRQSLADAIVPDVNCLSRLFEVG
ncbi:MAG: HAD family hydrolase [Candidatus Diapherotrites archaeon]